MAQPRPPSPPRQPLASRIPDHIVDPPTLRLALASLFVLVQAYKLADALWPQPVPATPSPTADDPLNLQLVKWLVADAGTVALVSFLRVPRLDWGWKARWAIRLTLWASDWLLFGRWTFSASYLLPVAVKSFVTRALSTDERKVRPASVVGSDKSHLGGQFTVRILAVSTAMLNPLSTIYCRHASPHSASRSLLPGGHHKADPTLIPLVFNNTVPAKVTYTLTSFDDPPSSHQVTVPASSLVRHAHPSHHRNRGDPSSSSSSSTHNNLDDELALASEWALVPASSSSNAHGASAKGPAGQHALRHRLPSDGPAAAAAPDASDPFGLAPSESLYYLPVSSLGLVRLDSVVDKDGHSVRIRRKRAVTAASAATAGLADPGAVALAFEEVRIVRCPSAGFDLGAGASRSAVDEEHRCLVPNAGLPESWPLGLAVSGAEPLSVRWHARVGDPQRGTRKDETLDGIVGGGGDGDGDNDVVPVPMNVSLAQAGRTTYYLDAVVDAYGNEVTYDLARSSSSSSPDGTTKDKLVSGVKDKAVPHLLPGTVASRSVVVHRPPEVAFVGECAKGDDVHLLEGGRKKLQLRLQGVDDDLRAGEGAFDVHVRFSPAATTGVKGWTRLVKTTTARAEIEVDQAGTYEVVGVKSKHCSGAVLVPNTCTLVVQPRPTLSTTFTPIHDVCNAETGAVASLHLTGAPPFVVHYAVSQLDSSGSRAVRTTRKQRRVQHSRDEVRLEAPGPGRWEYRFTRVDDRFYQGVVDLPEGGSGAHVYRQEVAEVGDAKWRNVKEGKTVHSCEGETVQVEIELQGTAPWDIEYSVVGQSAQAIQGITKSPYTLEVDIPSHIAQQGGQFALSLESVRDAHGCKRPLTGSDLNVEVRRTKPTARFHGAEGVRTITLRDDDTARIPLRLTGEGPWTITYQSPAARDGKLPSPSTFSTKDANGEIAIRRPRAGTYRLVGVRDQFCPGDVAETEWTVKTLPRPTLRLDERAGKVARGGSVVRRGVCANAVDSVPVLFEGKAPFKASYTLQKGSHHGDTRSHHLQAIQSRADLTLFTASPGRHTYTFTGVGDSLYTSPDAAGLEAPAGGKDGVVRIEQDVWALPTAGFAHGAKHGFCVHDKLASRGHDDLVLRLEGQAPFEVELEVREDGHRASKRFTVPAIQGHEWPVSLPYGLSTATPHSILLRRVKDAHGCETLVDPSTSSSSVVGAGSLKSSVSIPVAEIATITPVSSQVDHCVGDALEFIVQGSPPFTVKYEFEGKQHAVAHSSGTFQRLAAAPGTFKILSVGHGEDQCRSNSVDLVKHVHPIPSARVQTGDSYVVDIREGEQTEIKFSFSGTPPFAFTYARRAPQDRSKDRTVLEQHTVTGIKEHEYSIFTAQEGTWSVSYISDAFCSYPPPSSPPAQRSAVVKA
ncbi:uncharacterized protein RHOBADRAFT_52352 [Rhodotorula graminis WP1]|uniref:Nucleoporin Pom152 n=1 Tax=Rhodotorula graminis (strain WP1) TaxID=578459 RepID=A0A194S707_RHOGW|nr:uncharacterized protein RHOBADRAFT_52352 [Rhodotorula graminis WP1]KPV76329.1 hypothetical protein RHOBADRAFT_52352 [Rhodotorula graminis WP1]